MQPDDLPFFEEWSPPAHYDGVNDGAAPFPAGGMPKEGGLAMGQAYAASSMCRTLRYRIERERASCLRVACLYRAKRCTF